MNYVLGKRILNILNRVIFSRENTNTNIDVSVSMLDLRVINMSSECEYDWYWKISACSTEFEVCDSFASLTRHQTSYSGCAGWYFRYQSIDIQITYTYRLSLASTDKLTNERTMVLRTNSPCKPIDPCACKLMTVFVKLIFPF